ncbi:MAG: thiamine pyrophosphate-binding protein [Hyphomicrobiaceae bacterium]|nr:thiamine pyrophosphate-binding protein [Hyphomicrobiaceae bacterium]
MNVHGSTTPNLANVVVSTLKNLGVKRIFGIPGGGSSLELIQAAGNADVEFVLTRTETAAAIMAAVTGELTSTPGVLLTGIGPGATSAVNGIAYASLEKAPVLLITDGPASSPHQALDQNALFAPITKFQDRLRPNDGPEVISRALETAMTRPWGPVQLDLTAGDAVAPVSGAGVEVSAPELSSLSTDALEATRNLLNNAKKPVIIAGLEARHGSAPSALQTLAIGIGCPVLTTYKASGVLPASHPGFAGHFTGAVAESQVIHDADLIVLFGFDAIEMIPGRWSYQCPVIDLRIAEAAPLPVTPDVSISGDLSQMVKNLIDTLKSSDWTDEEISSAREGISRTVALEGSGHTVQSVMEAVSEIVPKDTRLTVDAGAHMFATLASWRAEEPFSVLKSNGLSTMGFALPAALASSLEHPDRPVVAVTGDGGMMMMLAELTTAVERNANITIVVINDAALSLIDIKQQRQQFRSSGVRYANTDFARAAEGLGCRAWRVEEGHDFAGVLKDALAGGGPALIDVVANPDGYGEQLARLRG